MVISAALSTVAAVFPGLASGALAVQVSADLGVDEGVYGWTFGSFFAAAALTSVAAGRSAQRLGPRRQLMGALVMVAVIQLLIATVVSSFGALLVCLAAAGAANSTVQTAVNLALTQARLPRLGLAMATKQSAMPASSMLGGLAVPLLALTLGWRWAYAMGALVALVALVLVTRYVAPQPTTRGAAGVVESPRRALLGAAIVSMALSFTAGSLNAWTVSSGVDAGLSEGTAGLMLSAAAGTGILLRLLIGFRVDRTTGLPFRLAGFIVLCGAAGFALMAIRVPVAHALATLLAFGGGWTWPVLSNFAIVNANPRSAGAATGMTQMGVYLGVFSGPVVTGVLIDQTSYEVMWLAVAVVALVGALGAIRIAPSFPR